MKNTLVPETVDDLIEFIKHHELEIVITQFRMESNNDMGMFGLPPNSATIEMTMLCTDKNENQEPQDILEV